MQYLVLRIDDTRRVVNTRPSFTFEKGFIMYSLEINGEANIAYCEAKGLSKCFMAYADNASGETIESIGFNPNSGYVYIALENGVQIVYSMGQDVEFLTTRMEDGCELFYDSYEGALNSLYLEDEEEDEEEEG